MSEKEYKARCESLFAKNTVLLNQQKIDAEQIRALQKQNGELTDELTLANNECKKMREELKQRIRENQKLCEQIEKGKVVEHFEAYGQCRDSRRIADLEAKLTKAVKHLKDLVYVVELGKNELATARIAAEAKEFLKETK